MFVQFQSTPYATYLIILLTFFVGLFVASLLGISERFRLRRLLKAKDKEIDTLSSELNSLRNLPITSETLSPNGDNGQFKDKALDNDSKKAAEKPMEDIVNNDDRDGDLKPESEEKETLK